MSEKNFASYGDMETLVTEIVDKCGPYTEISYEDWLQLTPYQQEHGRWDVTGVPGADGTISIDLMTKLWENPSPTSSFATQNITLSSDDYDLLLIVFRVSTNSERHCSELTVKGSGATLSIAEYTSNAASSRTRYFSYSTETVYNISAGYINGAQDNNIIIPYRIYGIKLHHTVEIKAIAPEVSTLASKCMMSDGETSVEDRLDANVVGTGVDIRSYTSSTNKYVFPSDGYVSTYASGESSYIITAINGMSQIARSGCCDYTLQYVKKGMNFYVQSVGSSGKSGAKFHPLS